MKRGQIVQDDDLRGKKLTVMSREGGATVSRDFETAAATPASTAPVRQHG
jgi:hypothetical protein